MFPYLVTQTTFTISLSQRCRILLRIKIKYSHHFLTTSNIFTKLFPITEFPLLFINTNFICNYCRKFHQGHPKFQHLLYLPPEESISIHHLRNHSHVRLKAHKISLCLRLANKRPSVSQSDILELPSFSSSRNLNKYTLLTSILDNVVQLFSFYDNPQLCNKVHSKQLISIQYSLYITQINRLIHLSRTIINLNILGISVILIWAIYY